MKEQYSLIQISDEQEKRILHNIHKKASIAINTSFNILLALSLICCSLPLMLIIALIVKFQDGGHIFFNGVRLGINKKPFTMYKFRTLVPEASKITKAELLTHKHKLETFSGKFLRDTRLDELPQLFNILKGDMDFLGPRPERPAVYRKICKNIKGYDKRFTVKPGLIGYSQLFTPHSSPKRIRTFIDNSFLKKKHNLFMDFGLIVCTILIVTETTCRKIAKIIWKTIIKSKMLGIYAEKRTLERKWLKFTRVYIESQARTKKPAAFEGELIDINDEAFRLYCEEEIKGSDYIFKLEIRHKIHKCEIKKSAFCYGKIYRESENRNNRLGNIYVIKYRPVSPLHAYLIDQYFIPKSVIQRDDLLYRAFSFRFLQK